MLTQRAAITTKSCSQTSSKVPTCLLPRSGLNNPGSEQGIKMLQREETHELCWSEVRRQRRTTSPVDLFCQESRPSRPHQRDHFRTIKFKRCGNFLPTRRWAALFKPLKLMKEQLTGMTAPRLTLGSPCVLVMFSEQIPGWLFSTSSSSSSSAG